MNTLYYGDNLEVLREHIKDETIDLIYLDPPFNSSRSYNVLFKDEDGSSDAQINAFDDTWHWGESAERTYADLVQNSPMNVATMINAMQQFIGRNQMMAYLVMMAARLVELHRVLKPTGSLYLHCDPTASHYLKILLDMIFGPENFRNEIIWKRTFAHGNTGNNFGSITDILFWYSKGSLYTWNQIFNELDDDYVKKFYKYFDSEGRQYRTVTLRNPGYRPNLIYPYTALNGITYQPHPNGWVWTKEKLRKADEEGLLVYPSKPSGALMYKQYIDKSKGIRLSNLWDDIPPIGAQAAERLGYPTQKPLALLERIIQASSNPGDLVLDPFSGCGTCIAAAQKMGRNWIGIDITHLAIAMHKSRLKDMFGMEPGKDYKVVGEPEDLGGAHQLAHEDRYQFQWWALSLIKARPLGGSESSKEGKKGSDKGIDGAINILDDRKGNLKRALVQVKSGHVNSAQIRDLKGTIEREKAEFGIFITLEPATRDMETEAVSAGFYHSEIWNKDYPRIQILSIEDLLAGAEVQLPPTPTNAAAFKQAEKEKKDDSDQLDLGI